jgi:beta-glucanase (GH16 family)
VPFDSSYVLVFDEEFNGSSLDTTNTWFAPILQHDSTYPNTGMTEYLPWNNTVHDGCLDQAVTAGPTPDGSAYGTAGVTTQGTTVPGQAISDYWEIRAKFADNAYGLASTFSTYVSPNYDDPEVDFYEYWQAEDPNETHQDYYYPTCCTPLAGKSNYGSDLAAQYHVYGTWWTPNFIRFYIDGVQMQETTANVNQTGPVFYGVPVFTAGGSAYPSSATVLPNHMYIDYIHVYSSQAGATAVPPQANYGGPGDATGSTSCQ